MPSKSKSSSRKSKKPKAKCTLRFDRPQQYNGIAHFFAAIENFPAPVGRGQLNYSEEFQAGYREALQSGAELLQIYEMFFGGVTARKGDARATEILQETLALLEDCK